MATATFLDLPRELYLIICSYLTTWEVTQLAGASRDHYLAAQQPLFNNVRLTSYGRLIKLVGALMKAPIVSHISPKQRQQWYKLSDAQLREREIKHIDLLLDSRGKDGRIIAGAVLSRCLYAICRKCDRVKITLTLLALPDKLLKELGNVALPNVTKLSLFMAQPAASSDGRVQLLSQVIAEQQVLNRKACTLILSASTFPDLRSVYMTTFVDCAENLPPNMEEGILLADRARPRRRFAPFAGLQSKADTPFYGLSNIQELKLEYNALLDASLLMKLFESDVKIKHLTTLELVHCPCLHPIKDLEALATLLRRGLQLVQFLKMHLTPYWDGHQGHTVAYGSKIEEHPEYHLCHIIRELGQKIKSLDLAIPFACKRIFAPSHNRKSALARIELLELPAFPEESVTTLPEQLMAAGYRYRRLIFSDFCREAHDWEEMAEEASNQEEKMSWELLYDAGDVTKGMWFVSGCAPVEFDVQAAMQRPLSRS